MLLLHTASGPHCGAVHPLHCAWSLPCAGAEAGQLSCVHPAGTVAIWNLLTKSLLQRVCQPDGSLKLYPFQSFLAHDHAVRSIEWCKANR